MTVFEDGPAGGRHLMLKRAPMFLRVVVENGNWDALDQLGDTPDSGETIHAYRLHGQRSRCHILAGKASGWYPVARYVFCPEQPADAEMRDTVAWRKWCERRRATTARPAPGPSPGS